MPIHKKATVWILTLPPPIKLKQNNHNAKHEHGEAEVPICAGQERVYDEQPGEDEDKFLRMRCPRGRAYAILIFVVPDIYRCHQRCSIASGGFRKTLS